MDPPEPVFEMPSDDSAPFAPENPNPSSSAGVEHPTRIGAYRIRRILGEGGMGIVYLAEQTEPVRREVALKVLKPGMDTRRIVARFEAERQALAVMEHPGIATVFDAGTTEAGLPYFVMERVDGVPITEYCDAQRLGVRERVRLFADVCRAVQHAHQKGIIHRDLKSSNVLVTTSDGNPRCKIIDFGIAKATARDEATGTKLTEVNASPGTPAYMSPEQVDAGELDIDTRSDVYSLGVLLYELLAGDLPFDESAYRGVAFQAHLLLHDPPLPSARFASTTLERRKEVADARGTEPGALARRLRGDPDWIVMRAMEKDRDRRYETANGFALDLDRYLADEAVFAGPPSRAYRARKFARRHRTGVAFGVLVALLLVGFAGAMGVQAERVARARDLAVVRQGQAEDLIGFMVGDLRARLTPVGRLDILDDVGEQALAYFAAVPEAELSDEELFRRAETIRQIGEVRIDQGNLDDAMEAFVDALALSQELADRDPSIEEWQVGLGSAHFWIGEVFRRRGDLASALPEYVTYRTIAADLVARDSANSRWLRELSMAEANVGVVAYLSGDVPTAVDAWTSRLQLQRTLSAEDPDDLEQQFALSNAYNQLGIALEATGALEAALTHLQGDVAIKRSLLDREPENLQNQGYLAVSLNYLGRISEAVGRADSTRVYLQEELALNEPLAAHDPTNIVWARRLLISRARLGRQFMEEGAFDEARVLLDRALASAIRLQETDPGTRVHHQDVAVRLRDRADLALAERDHATANRLVTSAIETATAVMDEAPDDRVVARILAIAHLSRAELRTVSGQVAGARDDHARALTLLEPFAADSRDPSLLDPLARTYLHLGRHAEAAEVIDRLQAIGYRAADFTRFMRAHNRGTETSP